MIVLKTSRLVVRRLTPADIDALHAVYGDAEVVRWAGDGQPLSRALCAQWVEVTLRNYAARGYGMFVLERQDDGTVVGFCGLVHPGGQAEADIKYALARAHWGKGYATEAATALLGHAATALGLRQVIATAAPENTASHRVLRKAGLVHGDLRPNDDGGMTQCFVWHAAEPAGAPCGDPG